MWRKPQNNERINDSFKSVLIPYFLPYCYCLSRQYTYFTVGLIVTDFFASEPQLGIFEIIVHKLLKQTSSFRQYWELSNAYPTLLERILVSSISDSDSLKPDPSPRFFMYCPSQPRVAPSFLRGCPTENRTGDLLCDRLLKTDVLLFFCHFWIRIRTRIHGHKKIHQNPIRIWNTGCQPAEHLDRYTIIRPSVRLCKILAG
jgi:hypothetical protein